MSASSSRPSAVSFFTGYNFKDIPKLSKDELKKELQSAYDEIARLQDLANVNENLFHMDKKLERISHAVTGLTSLELGNSVDNIHGKLEQLESLNTKVDAMVEKLVVIEE